MTTTKTIGRTLPNGAYMEVTATERDDSGTLSPGFSITGSIWERYTNASGRARARMGRDSDLGGCIHDEILRYFPRLAPLVTAHLANPDGVPMHAEANAWYFYSGAHIGYEMRHYGAEYVERHGTPHERAARALHIEPRRLPGRMTRARFAEFCEELRTTVWAEQARAARECLAAIEDGDGVEPR